MAQFWFTVRPFAGNFMYAVLETGSKQYRVAAGDKLEIERLEIEAGKPVTFDRILLVNNEGKVIGINFAMVREFGGSNFAIPVGYGKSLLEP